MATFPQDLLSDPPSLTDESIRWLESIGFQDGRSAYRCLQHLARSPAARQALEDILPYLMTQVKHTASPDRVVINLERLADSAPDPVGMLQYLAGNPRTLDILIVIFSSSQFLTEILLRNPSYTEKLADQVRMIPVKTAEQYYQEALCLLPPFPEISQAVDALRRYQRTELLRIGSSDLMALADLSAVTGQLSNLADAMARACLFLIMQSLGMTTDPANTVEGFTVIAMGKLGGRELNYSSDIDLLFLSRSDLPIFTRLGEKLIEALAGVTSEGFLYRVDMRLRPWGRAGALVSTLEGYLHYLAKDAKVWEKQALLKARVIAGDRNLGTDFLQRSRPIVFNLNQASTRAEVFGMKQRTEAYLRQNGRAWGEVKLGEGSIRDIEFVVQYLQLVHGGKQPEIRSRNTLRAIHRMVEYGYLPLEESRTLSGSYVFLRTVEHHLQMMHYRQTYSLPNDPASLANLSKRLGFQGENAGEEFVTRYQQHCAAIRSIFLYYLGERDMDTPDQPASTGPEVQRHIERMDPSYEATFNPKDIKRHAALAGQLDAQHLAQVEAVPLEDGHWRVTIVAYDYPGELSLICGLMFVHGLGIDDGNVFTYEPLHETGKKEAAGSSPRKIVDVFTVHPPSGEITMDVWLRYADDLDSFLRLMRAGQRQEARVQLAKRAAEVMSQHRGSASPLYPIDIEIDNEASQRYSVLRITGRDTTGFLYELTNALAFNRIYIAQVQIETVGAYVSDTLYGTDSDGRKITSLQKQREMRAATVLIKHFTHLLPLSPDPESALLHFHAFIGELFRHPNWPDELASLEQPEVLGALAQLLGVSDFLWDDFLRMQHASLFPVVRDVDALAAAKPRAVLEKELASALSTNSWIDVLNEYKDREMFRIDMRHILGYTKEFWDFAEELTELSEVVIHTAYQKLLEHLKSTYGTPFLEDGSASKMTICALGKCGGCELGFASDIELMFIYDGNGKTSGPEVITTGEFYEKVVENFVRAIHARREGIFEIDLQLRPYGKAGNLAVSLEAFRRYFTPDGPAWPYERQALVRLRPVAGDLDFGKRIESLRDSYIYTHKGFDVTAMRAMRERQIRHLVKGGTFHPKFSPGGLVDVEYLVQGLQMIYGADNPKVRTTNTREAMAALTEAGILTSEDYTRLRKAHTFLRWLIDSQRVVAGNAKDLVVPSEDSEEFAYLARRLRYEGDRGKLREEMRTHTAYVQEVNRRLLGT